MAILDNYAKRLLALDAKGYSRTEIAAVLTDEVGEPISADMVRHGLDKAKLQILTLVDMPSPDRVPYVNKYMDYITGDKPPEPKDNEAKAKVLLKAKSKLLVQADLHIPFHDEKIVSESISQNIDADVYIGVADIMDVYAHSFFSKSIDMPFLFEIDEVLRFLEYLSVTFSSVLLLEANHEQRVKKTLQQMLPPSLQFLIEENVLERLAAPFPNIIVYNEMWFFQYGSALFAHPEKASSVELRAAISVYEHFKEWEYHYDLKPWDTIVVAHTHNASVAYTTRAKIIEIGCLSLPMGYGYSPKLPYKRPARRGYAVLTMEYGVVNWNESREYVFADAGMVKGRGV